MFGLPSGPLTQKQRYSVVGLCFALFVAAPFVPNGVLAVTVGNLIGVFVLLAAALIAVRIDMTAGIAVFLAAGALFFENRKRLLLKVEAAAAAATADGPSYRAAADVPAIDAPAKLADVGAVEAGAPDLVEGEVHPEHETPEGESVAFAPAESTGSDAFEPVAESINGKLPLASGTPTSATAAATSYVRAGLV